MANIILAGGENHDGGQAKQVSGLVPIWKRTEAALIDPERKRNVRPIKQNTDSRQDHNSGRKKTELKTRGAQLELLGCDHVEPAEAGDETNQAPDRDPWLRCERRYERNVEIAYDRRSPGRHHKPRVRQERDRRPGQRDRRARN